jgi:hypothetical protein
VAAGASRDGLPTLLIRLHLEGNRRITGPLGGGLVIQF